MEVLLRALSKANMSEENFYDLVAELLISYTEEPEDESVEILLNELLKHVWGNTK